MSDTFTLFPLLPAKLPIRIWHHAIPLFPGVITVRFNDDFWKGLSSRRWKVIPSSTQTLLSVNQESRHEALAECARPSNADNFENPTTLFNFASDTLFIEFIDYVMESQYLTTPALSHIFGEALEVLEKQLRRLGGDADFWQRMAMSRFAVPDMKGLSGFEKLEEIIYDISDVSHRPGKVGPYVDAEKPQMEQEIMWILEMLLHARDRSPEWRMPVVRFVKVSEALKS